MPAPLAYHLTWHTYGSWLPGHERGWVERDTPGIQPPNDGRQAVAQEAMTTEAVTLDEDQRAIVAATIRDHCRIRAWTLHAVHVGSTHVHVVVTADRDPKDVLDQFKSWCSRRLNEKAGVKGRWWVYHGSTKWINDEAYLANAVRYVQERQ